MLIAASMRLDVNLGEAGPCSIRRHAFILFSLREVTE
jgi:hypothetical protein